MFVYPISLPWPRPKRIKHIHQSIAREYHKRIEDYINKVAKDLPSPGKDINYPEIADATGIDNDDVRIFVYPLTGNPSGITVGNPNLKEETST